MPKHRSPNHLHPYTQSNTPTRPDLLADPRTRHVLLLLFVGACIIFGANILPAVELPQGMTFLLRCEEKNPTNYQCGWEEGAQTDLFKEWKETDTNSTQATSTTTTSSSILQVLEHDTDKVFAGTSILVIGGSTSRSLAADFLQMTLAPDARKRVAHAWKNAGVQGFQLFPGVGKRVMDFHRQYNSEVMQPLVEAGWNFTHLRNEDSGCVDCKSSYTNIDYVAKLHGGHTASSNGISYEFSWKPDIFAPIADTRAFQNRFCPPNNHYDVVYIGRGLHDAAFESEEGLQTDALDGRIRKLGNLLECFPPEIMVVFRTPYVSAQSKQEQDKVQHITSSIVRLVQDEGVFGRLNRTIIIDGHVLTSSQGHPTSHDGHHYDSSLARTMWRLIALSYHRFSNMKLTHTSLRGDAEAERYHGCGKGLHPFEEILFSHWKDCGITAV